MDLILVNAPVDSSKKAYNLAFPFFKTLNFGCLAIASYIKEKGFKAIVFDPQTHPHKDPFSILLKEIEDKSPIAVGLSCNSGFSYLSCKAFAFAIRYYFPSIKIIVGGKDHVGHVAESVLSDCSAIDVVVQGEGEEVTYQLIDSFIHGKPLSRIPNIVYRNIDGRICSTHQNSTLNKQRIPQLNYSLYPGFHEFAPSLEVSRGCPFECAFCVTAGTRVRKKKVQSIINEAEYISRMYNDDKIRIYFETPLFLMKSEEILEFALMRKERGLDFTWRTSTRADYLKPARFRSLANAGLRVVDLGLESACPKILLEMRKTHDPQRYLGKVAEALRVAYELGVIIKLNVLFYIGETSETLKTTLSFLEQNLPHVTSVSAYPLLLSPGMSLEQEIEHDFKIHGGSIVEDSFWRERHLRPVNSSIGFGYKRLQELGLLFAKSFQTMKTYYTQKQYGYFSPGISYAEFVEHAERSGIENLPFSRDSTEAQDFRMRLWNLLE